MEEFFKNLNDRIDRLQNAVANLTQKVERIENKLFDELRDKKNRQRERPY